MINRNINRAERGAGRIEAPGLRLLGASSRLLRFLSKMLRPEGARARHGPAGAYSGHTGTDFKFLRAGTV